MRLERKRVAGRKGVKKMSSTSISGSYLYNAGYDDNQSALGFFVGLLIMAAVIYFTVGQALPFLAKTFITPQTSNAALYISPIPD